MSALLAVFAVVFLGAAVEWIGYSGIASKIYDLIGGLVGINLSKQLNTSRDELLLLRQQLKATSAMVQSFPFHYLLTTLHAHTY